VGQVIVSVIRITGRHDDCGRRRPPGTRDSHHILRGRDRSGFEAHLGGSPSWSDLVVWCESPLFARCSSQATLGTPWTLD